ncbi:MAG: hypothetical protein MMC33_006340 [Icmadophila ericetorum]|nr:hypothetical protein [Icmadophila ericetorum]
MVFSTFRPVRPNESRSLDLRYRPFRSASSSSAGSIPQVPASNGGSTTTSKEPDLTDLNNSLLALAAIFPDVRPEVFREMLGQFSGRSRLHVVAEQLIKHKVKWVKDRYRTSSEQQGSSIVREVFKVEKPTGEGEGQDEILVREEEKFRTTSYKQAVRHILCQEFKTLSKSTIDGVLAEQNFSYTSARPILLGVKAKSWRISLSSLLSRWQKPVQSTSDIHFMLLVSKSQDGNLASLPSLKETGDKELDLELYDTILKPLLEKRKQELQQKDLRLATTLNEVEAEKADALFECECCFSSTTFETMATCTTGEHTICFNCIQHAISEALYGQSWGLNIDHARAQVACIAPTATSTPCNGCIPHFLACRAVTSGKAGSITWEKLETRLTTEALQKSSSGSPLVKCPFCPYAEIDDLYLPFSQSTYSLHTTHPLRTLALLFLAWNFLPLIIYYFFLSIPLSSLLPPPQLLLQASLRRLKRRTHLPLRFRCQNPSCGRASCLQCQKPWRDPHICHESAAKSLRTTIEAARTAALKRTCPRCGLGFVKESGCNKMVCVCGYTMCYICRQGLGSKSNSLLAGRGGDQGGAAAAAEDGGGEGYRHFCQHFRPSGGRCTECERCDLYRGEDEDEVVRRAGEKAEREWRIREGWDRENTGVAGGSIAGSSSSARVPSPVIKGLNDQGRTFGVQEVVDWWVERVIKV